MKKFLIIWCLCFGLAQAGETVSRYQDRGTDKMVSNPDNQPSLSGKSGEATAFAYLSANYARFGLSPDAANVVLDRVRHSLLATHYHYRQELSGIPVERAEVIVSINKKGAVSRVFNGAWPVRSSVAAKSTVQLDRHDAMDVAWRHLNVFGELNALPSSEKVWLPENGAFTLAYRVSISTTGPAGAWSVAVDAVDGKVLSVEEVSRDRSVKATDFLNYDGEFSDYGDEVARFKSREKQLRQKRESLNKRAEGTARIFDPDPRTTLMDDNLGDDDENAAFTDAYMWVDLLDISTDMDGRFVLNGPWIHISDWDFPTNAPSISIDGVWDFDRGNNGFNDAMTYFHIDQSQRFIQSMGYKDATGIQFGSIEVDTDGANGADNSFFNPNNNGLTFGHGCVDDNEDADVILHEYGHAMQFSINPAWSRSGDEGAIGEGFGDYWGGSYSFKTPNGPVYHPEWIYSWDGHGTEMCSWEGRVLNRLDAIYDPTKKYWDHAPLVDGFIPDEVWSTPLFQAMLELYHQGVPIEESDQVVLEGHFGVGTPMKMFDLAASTVAAAADLFPEGPHAQVFQNAFGRHQILDRVASYTYHSPHLSPATSGWLNEVVLYNPGDSAATVTATVFEGQSSGGLTSYSELSNQTFELAAGERTTFVPPGEMQRWVRFNSDQPLGGTTAVWSDEGDKGEQRITVPLLSETEVATELIVPHIPADREVFFSATALLNPNDVASDLTVELIGEAGSDLSHLLSPSVPAQLEPNQKYLSQLADGIFDDSASEEKVSWLRITGSQPLAGFQIFGFFDTQGQAATSSIILQPDHRRAFWPIRASRTDSDFTAFSILNPTGAATFADAQLVFSDGSLSETRQVTLEPRKKLLGRNTAAGFTFPVDETQLFTIPAGAQVQAMLLNSDQPLRIFELAGDEDGSTLDGAAVTGVTSHAVFPKATGTLEVVRYGYPGEVQVIFHGGTLDQKRTLQVGESWVVAIPAGVDAVEIKGALFQATVITKDQTNRSLATVNGKQVEFVP